MTGRWILAALALIASPATAQQLPAYSDWVFFQSDKALQVRSVLLSVDGAMASMRYEFRLNRDDPIFCRDADCRGYVLAAYNYDPDTRDATDRFSVFFPNDFSGVWTYPATVKTRFTTYPNGDRSFWDEHLGAAFVSAGGSVPRKLNLVEGCADNRLASTDYTRCDDLGRAKLIDLTGTRGAMETVDIPASDVPASVSVSDPAREPAVEAPELPADTLATAPADGAAPPLDIAVPAAPVDPQAGASLELNAQAAAAARAQSERIAAEQAAAAAQRARYAADQAAYAEAQAKYAADQAAYQAQLQAAQEAQAAYERAMRPRR